MIERAKDDPTRQYRAGLAGVLDRLISWDGRPMTMGEKDRASGAQASLLLGGPFRASRDLGRQR